MEKKQIAFNKFYKLFNLVSISLIIISVLLLFFKGLNYGVDFKGGTLIELRANDSQINIFKLRQSLLNMKLGDVSVKQFGNQNDYLIKFEKKNDNNPNFIQEIKDDLTKSIGPGFNFRRVENVGPKVSSELLQSGIIAISLSLIAMLFYIWLRFEWQFSVGAIAALVHDIVITIGIFSLLQIKFDLAIIAALLTIVGYSLNDTVVVFDRVRENLRKYKKTPLKDLLNMSINATLSRTVMTSLTTLIALISLFILGGDVIHGFVFAMIWGVIIGTYSSVFVASSILLRLGVKRDWDKTNDGKAGTQFAGIDA